MPKLSTLRWRLEMKSKSKLKSSRYLKAVILTTQLAGLDDSTVY